MRPVTAGLLVGWALVAPAAGAADPPRSGGSSASDAGAPAPAAPPVGEPGTTGPGTLVPPRWIAAERVPYPDGGRGAASVLCELVVDTGGGVASARVVEGATPFSDAVIAAAPSFRFEPARRGDTPVAARIRLRIDFTPPEAAPPAASAPAGEDRGAPGGGARAPAPGDRPSAARVAAGVEEVTVLGAREEVGEMRFGGGEVREVPGAFGDAFRVLEALPGVTPIVSGLPFFFVRGAPPGNVGYFLDGVRLPILYHLGAGPSVVHPGLVDHVDFWAGGYPARYGRFAGGVLAAETKAPAVRARGEGNVRLFDVGALVETPFADGKGTVLVGGRYSYTAALLSLVAPDTRLAYWDYQARLTWRLGPRDRVGLFVFGSYDDLQTRDDADTPFRPVFNTQFHRADLRWDHAWAAGDLRVAVTLGEDSTRFEQSATNVRAETSTLRARTIGARAELDVRVAEDLRVRAGADAWVEGYELVRDVSGPGAAGGPPAGADDALDRIYPPRVELVGGLRGDVVWKPHGRVELVAGLRLDAWVQRRTGAPTLTLPAEPTSPAGTVVVPGVDPRLGARVGLGRGVVGLATVALAHQPPSFLVAVPGLRPGSIGAGLQTAAQTSLGVEVALPWEVTASAVAFSHAYLDLTDVTATCRRVDGTDDLDNTCVDERVRGRTFGLELFVRRPLTRRLTGWISYTLSRSTRQTRPPRFRFPRSDLAPASEIPSEFDRTHVLSAVGAYDLGRGWRAGARFAFYTGRPFTRTVSGYPLPPYNSERMPAFTRLDLRLEKRWRIGETGAIALVLEGLNVLARKEVTNMRCAPADPTGARTPVAGGFAADVCTPEEVGPITIPSIGVEGSF